MDVKKGAKNGQETNGKVDGEIKVVAKEGCENNHSRQDQLPGLPRLAEAEDVVRHERNQVDDPEQVKNLVGDRDRHQRRRE